MKCYYHTKLAEEFNSESRKFVTKKGSTQSFSKNVTFDIWKITQIMELFYHVSPNFVQLNFNFTNKDRAHNPYL